MGVAERGKLEVIHDAFQMLIHSLTDDELVEAGIAISCGIVERLTDIQTALDTRDHVRAYIWGIIDAYIDYKMEVKSWHSTSTQSQRQVQLQSHQPQQETNSLSMDATPQQTC